MALTVAALVLSAAALCATLLPAAAGASSPVVRVLGASELPPRPACPATDSANCMAVGKVTVFQTMAGLNRQPFVVPFRGRIVSWSITLARPTAAEIRGFNDFYGSPAQARIAVLRRMGDSRPPVYKMVRQSPIQELNRHFGRTMHFTLDRPLAVLKDQVVALTIPTWAPNWAINLPEDNAWRASRARNRCNDSDIEQHSRPHQAVRSDRQYGCFFTNTRFLYTATVVKEPAARTARAKARAARAAAARRAARR